MSDLTTNPALAVWMAGALGAAQAQVTGARKLSGGAIQENWALDVLADGAQHALVLRRDAPATIGASRSRAQEYALLEAAHAAGVLVPRPVGFCDDAQVIGAPFAVLERVAGEGYGPKVVRDRALGGDRDALARAPPIRQRQRLHCCAAGWMIWARRMQDWNGRCGNARSTPPRRVMWSLRTGISAPATTWSMRRG